MSEISTEKRQKAAALVQQCRAILDKAEAEKRDLTAEEQAEFDRKYKEAQSLNRELGGTYQTRRETLEAAEVYMSQSQGTIAGGLQDGSSNPFTRADVGADEWRDRTGRVTRALLPGESVRAYLEARDGVPEELQGIRLGQMMRAMATGCRNDQERRALALGVDTAGGYTAASILSAQVIDLMRPKLVINRAGARIVPLDFGGEFTFARVTEDPVPAWRAENAEVTEQEVVFGGVMARPRVLAMMVKVSRELIETAQNIESLLEKTLAKTMATKVDYAALVGGGPPIEPLGVASGDSINTLAHDSSANFEMIVKARTLMLEANSEEPTAAILSARDEGTLALLKDGEGLPMPRPPVIERLPIMGTTNMPTTYGDGENEGICLVGDFRTLLLPTWVGVRIQILQERFASNLQVGFLVWLMMDTILEQPESMCKITGLTASA